MAEQTPGQEAERAYMLRAQKTDWATPKELFDQLDAEFGPFDLDPCGQREHHYTAWRIESRGGLCYDGSTKGLDGLVQPWHGKVFMNPPYGRGVEKWIEKAVGEVECGNAELVVALLKATTDVRWWQRYVMTEMAVTQGHTFVWRCHATRQVRFLPGRLKFGGQEGPAPFPSAIVVWHKDTAPAAAEEQERML